MDQTNFSLNAARKDVILAAIIPLVMKEIENILSSGGSFVNTFGCDIFEYAAMLTCKFADALEKEENKLKENLDKGIL